MKKLLAIIVLGLLWSGNANAAKKINISNNDIDEIISIILSKNPKTYSEKQIQEEEFRKQGWFGWENNIIHIDNQKRAIFNALEAKFKEQCAPRMMGLAGNKIGSKGYYACIKKKINENPNDKIVVENNIKEQKITSASKPKSKQKIPQSKEVNPDLLTIGSGSGFYINSKGYALTNNHVVDICKQMIAIVEGKEILFRVLSTDKTNDVAIIKTDRRSPNYIKINERGAELGENIIAVGYPLSGRLSDSVKITRGIVSSLSGLNNNSGQIQIDAALQPGNSGGPVINENGELIGIASAGLNKLLMAKEAKYIPENVNFAVSSPIVTNILKNKEINYSSASFFSSSYSNTDLAKLGNKVTIQLFCRNTRSAYNRLKGSNKYSTILLDID